MITDKKLKHRLRLREYMRLNPQDHKPVGIRANAYKKAMDRNKAYSAVKNALKNGKLIKLPCVVCKDPRVMAHHEDYNQKLNITWLCGIHHKAIHNKEVMLLKK